MTKSKTTKTATNKARRAARVSTVDRSPTKRRGGSPKKRSSPALPKSGATGKLAIKNRNHKPASSPSKKRQGDVPATPPPLKRKGNSHRYPSTPDTLTTATTAASGSSSYATGRVSSKSPKSVKSDKTDKSTSSGRNLRKSISKIGIRMVLPEEAHEAKWTDRKVLEVMLSNMNKLPKKRDLISLASVVYDHYAPRQTAVVYTALAIRMGITLENLDMKGMGAKQSGKKKFLELLAKVINQDRDLSKRDIPMEVDVGR